MVTRRRYPNLIAELSGMTPEEIEIMEQEVANGQTRGGVPAGDRNIYRRMAGRQSGANNVDFSATRSPQNPAAPSAPLGAAPQDIVSRYGGDSSTRIPNIAVGQLPPTREESKQIKLQSQLDLSREYQDRSTNAAVSQPGVAGAVTDNSELEGRLDTARGQMSDVYKERRDAEKQYRDSIRDARPTKNQKGLKGFLRNVVGAYAMQAAQGGFNSDPNARTEDRLAGLFSPLLYAAGGQAGNHSAYNDAVEVRHKLEAAKTYDNSMKYLDSQIKDAQGQQNFELQQQTILQRDEAIRASQERTRTTAARENRLRQQFSITQDFKNKQADAATTREKVRGLFQIWKEGGDDGVSAAKLLQEYGYPVSDNIRTNYQIVTGAQGIYAVNKRNPRDVKQLSDESGRPIGPMPKIIPFDVFQADAKAQADYDDQPIDLMSIRRDAYSQAGQLASTMTFDNEDKKNSWIQNEANVIYKDQLSLEQKRRDTRAAGRAAGSFTQQPGLGGAAQPKTDAPAQQQQQGKPKAKSTPSRLRQLMGIQ